MATLVTVIATLCLAYGGECIDKVVTDQATFEQCNGSFAMQALPQWLADSGYLERGYHLAGWQCMKGGKRTPV